MLSIMSKAEAKKLEVKGDFSFTTGKVKLTYIVAKLQYYFPQFYDDYKG